MSGTPLEDATQLDQHLQLLRNQQAKFLTQPCIPVRADWAELPQGRVSYNAAAERFMIYADACIVKDPDLIREIKDILNLPPATEAVGDEHYRCAKCIRGESEQP